MARRDLYFYVFLCTRVPFTVENALSFQRCCHRYKPSSSWLKFVMKSFRELYSLGLVVAFLKSSHRCNISAHKSYRKGKSLKW